MCGITQSLVPSVEIRQTVRMHSRILAVANQKGGVGKTTTSVNLAACLAEAGRRVLLIDLDPQANATSGMGLAKLPGSSVYPVLLGETPLAAQVRETGIPQLKMVGAEVDLAGAEVDIARSEDYLHRLRRVLDSVSETGAYDEILIDCPPSLGILTMNALTAADSLLIPLQSEYYALEGLSVIDRLVRQLRNSGANPGLTIEGIVMTMYDMRTNLSRQVVQEVVQHFGDLVFETLIPRSVRLGEAPSHGLPITQYDPHSPGAVCYRQLARELLERRARKEADEAPEPEAEHIPTVSDLQPPPLPEQN